MGHVAAIYKASDILRDYILIYKVEKKRVFWRILFKKMKQDI